MSLVRRALGEDGSTPPWVLNSERYTRTESAADDSPGEWPRGTARRGARRLGNLVVMLASIGVVAGIVVLIVLLASVEPRHTSAVSLDSAVAEATIGAACGSAPSVPVSAALNVTPHACGPASDCSKPSCPTLGYRYGFRVSGLRPGTYNLCFTRDGLSQGSAPAPPPPPPPPPPPSGSSLSSSGELNSQAFRWPSSSSSSSGSLYTDATRSPPVHEPPTRVEEERGIAAQSVAVSLTGEGVVEDPRACVTFTVSEEGRAVNWTSTIALDAVLVSGDNCATNVYSYAPEAWSDASVGAPPQSVLVRAARSMGERHVVAKGASHTATTSGTPNACGTQDYIGERAVSGTMTPLSRNTMYMSYTYTAAGGTLDAICVYISNRDPSTSNRSFSVALYSGTLVGGPQQRLTTGTGTVINSSAYHCVDVPNVLLAPGTGYWFGYNTNAASNNYNNPYYTNENDGSADPPYKLGYAARNYQSGWPSNFGSLSSTSVGYELLIYGVFVPCGTSSTTFSTSATATTTTTGVSTPVPLTTTPPPSCVLGCDGVCNSGAVYDACGVCATPHPENVTRLVLTGVIRDFNATGTPGGHPDFEWVIATDKNITTLYLGNDSKPVYGDHPGGTVSTHGAALFNQWFNTVPGVNMEAPVTLTLVRQPSGVFRYDNDSFFPIDGRLFGNQGRRHNFHFCFELHMRFTYRGGEVFTFVGDDDVWVYINGKRGIDLGGVHEAQSATIDLDARASYFGIEVGGDYNLDFFYCERHTTEAEIRIDTSILLYTCTCLDACGVCGGDNSSCAGCDGVPHSGKALDECGVCGGDNSSCSDTPPLVTDVEFCYDYELRVTNDAEGLFDRLVRWAIDKEVVPAGASALAGQAANATYTVTLERHESDAQFRVLGTATIENPSPLHVTVAVDLGPAQDGSHTSVSCPADGVIAPYGVIECTYSVLDLTDTATALSTVTVTDVAGALDPVSAAAVVVFSGPAATVGDPDALELVDTADGLEPSPMGNFTGSASFSYTWFYVCPRAPHLYAANGSLVQEHVNRIADANATGIAASATFRLSCSLSVSVTLSKQFVCGYERVGRMRFAFVLRNADTGAELDRIDVASDFNGTFASAITAPGSYVVEEETPVPEGWATLPASRRCEFTVDASLNRGRDTLCAFVNIELGRLRFRKRVSPTHSLGDPSLLYWRAELYEGLATAGSGRLLWAGVVGATQPETDFGGVRLSPLETYTVCERQVPAGWSSVWTSTVSYADLDNSGTLDDAAELTGPGPRASWTDSVVPRDVERAMGTLCYSIIPGESPLAFAIKPGRTTVIEATNSPPADVSGAGAPSQRSTDYWLDWNSCNVDRPTQQAAYALYNSAGGAPNGFLLVDDVVNGSIDWYRDFSSSPGNLSLPFPVETCDEAVAILSMRDSQSGAPRGHDAAYILARTLLTAQLNFGAGAYACEEATQAARDAELALWSVGFVGHGRYLPPSAQDQVARDHFTSLAVRLERYSDGLLCY